MWRFAAALLPILTAGCVQGATLWYHLTGGETIEAKHKLNARLLAIVLDDPQGLITTPMVHQVVHEKLAEAFTANKIECKLVAYDELHRLRADEAAFAKLSVREIGEKLGADQVLYLQVTDFALRREPGAPLFQGRFGVRVSVISTEKKRDVRLWPREQGGEPIVAETQPRSSEGDVTESDVARELSGELADKVGKLFFDHKERT